MIDPQRMVMMSVTSSIVALAVLYIYFKFSAKKKINYLFLLFIISLPVIVSIFRAGSYESGDLSLHTMRSISFFNILFNEHLLPRWTPEFNAGYGDPHFLFAYFLPYFISAIFHFLGFSFLDSMKLVLTFSFILSGFAMYAWAKDELSEKAGFVSAVFYLFAPYHLVDLHFRVTVAETLSFIFLPLLLLLAKKILYAPTVLKIVTGAICYALLLLTHQITALTFSPVLISYALFVWFSKKKRHYKELVFYFASITGGFLISAFYWAPIIAEAKYTQASLANNIASFTPLLELLYSPWRLGFLFQGHKGELSFLIGYTQLLVVIVGLYLLIRKRLALPKKRLLIFFLILFSLLVFMITPESKDLWATLPLFKYSQYSYRLLEIVALCTSIIAGIVATKYNKKFFIIILCFITIFYTILNWGNRKAVAQINDSFLINEFRNRPDIPIYLEPSSPIWADLKKSKVRTKSKTHIEILSGKAQIKELSRTSITHRYLINAETQTSVKENTLYFPGWTLLVNGEEKNISYTDPGYPGIIKFSLPKGLYEVELTFRDTQIRSLSLLISVTTAIALLVSLLYNACKNYKTSLFFRNNTDIPRAKRKRKIT